MSRKITNFLFLRNQIDKLIQPYYYSLTVDNRSCSSFEKHPTWETPRQSLCNGALSLPFNRRPLDRDQHLAGCDPSLFTY